MVGVEPKVVDDKVADESDKTDLGATRGVKTTHGTDTT